MVRTIIFPFDEKTIIKEKVKIIKRMIGEDNVNTHCLNDMIPAIDIRCSKKVWKKIKFACELQKVYY